MDTPHKEMTSETGLSFNDLFGFEAAKKNQQERLLDQQVEPNFKPWRVFINHLDSYHGKKFVDLLPGCVYVDPLGSWQEGNKEEDEQENEEESKEDGRSEKDQEFDEQSTGRKSQRLRDTKIKIGKHYEIIGTLADRNGLQPEDVKMVIRDTSNRMVFLNELMNCGIIIYDITHNPNQIDEAQWALEAIVSELENMADKSPKAFKRNEDTQYFILISSLMTWALTKPLDPEDPDLPFTEADYRKRRPHPNFKRHSECEKAVVTVKKRERLAKRLKTLVICCGITYGDEEDTLHYLFRMGWMNAPHLPVIGSGRNKIPLLHVRDLTSVVHSVLQNWPPLQYIVATEQDRASQNTIVKKISKALTTGKTKNLSKAESFLLSEVTQNIYDMLTLDLTIDPVYIVDQIRWHMELPFRDSMSTIIKEFKTARNLWPIKIIVLGPPASGKTIVANYLAKYYGVHYVQVKNLIKDTIQNQTSQIEATKQVAEQKHRGGGGEEDNAETDEVDEEEDEEAGSVKASERELEAIRNELTENDGRLGDATLTKLFLNRLRSKECRNQGYVLDGHPKTVEQAKALFKEEEERLKEEEGGGDEEDEYGQEPLTFNASILPDAVIVLEASDDFLKERIILCPEKEIQHTHYTEEHMLRRLREYRTRNTDDYTPLSVFDEMEIHPLLIPVEDDLCPDMSSTISQCLKKIGSQRTYGLSPEEVEELRKRAEMEAQEAQDKLQRQREREQETLKRDREEKMIEWTNLMEKLKQEEEERLSVMGEPLRHYLAKYVLPTLTQGLVEVAKLRPDDPVDFLAEYLFKKNPEGKMFQPDFTETMSLLLDQIKMMQEHVLNEEEVSESVTRYLECEDAVKTGYLATYAHDFHDLCATDDTMPCPPSCCDDTSEELEELKE